MAISQAQVDALEAALTSGELRVSYDGRTVEYRSIDDLKKAIAYCKGEISAAEGTLRRRVNFTDAPRQKGWT